jgi:thymidylate synthase (FAD)
MLVVESSVELLSMPPNPAQLIECAGRTCYRSEAEEITDETAAKFIAMILKRGHESVIEHPSATFRIICDRGITHEIVRHRLASYSQESSRYCNYTRNRFGNEITTIVPAGVRDGTPAYARWRIACDQAEYSYFKLIEKGEKPQIARSVLPTCLKTEIVMTANFREWRHFLRLRLSKAAHPDMQPIAYRIWGILMEHCPPVFEVFREAAAAYEERTR